MCQIPVWPCKRDLPTSLWPGPCVEPGTASLSPVHRFASFVFPRAPLVGTCAGLASVRGHKDLFLALERRRANRRVRAGTHAALIDGVGIRVHAVRCADSNAPGRSLRIIRASGQARIPWERLPSANFSPRHPAKRKPQKLAAGSRSHASRSHNHIETCTIAPSGRASMPGPAFLTGQHRAFAPRSVAEFQIDAEGARTQPGCRSQVRGIDGAAFVRQVVGEQVYGPALGRLDADPGRKPCDGIA